MITEEEAFARLTSAQRESLESTGPRVKVVVESSASRAQKYVRIIEIADHAMKTVAHATPCRKGCAHCCKVAVAITEREALRIEQYSGRRMVRLPFGEPEVEVERLHDNVGRYTNVPCPFLGAENECTVYPVRPVTCRVYHSLNETAHECDPTNTNIVPRFDLRSTEYGVTLIDLDKPTGDIREFFP